VQGYLVPTFWMCFSKETLWISYLWWSQQPWLDFHLWSFVSFFLNSSSKKHLGVCRFFGGLKKVGFGCHSFFLATSWEEQRICERQRETRA
jgi:hypothetical protein